MSTQPTHAPATDSMKEHVAQIGHVLFSLPLRPKLTSSSFISTCLWHDPLRPCESPEGSGNEA